jgi:polysaccharide deacetylase 2 family uncharacterized protein YibQ
LGIFKTPQNKLLRRLFINKIKLKHQKRHLIIILAGFLLCLFLLIFIFQKKQSLINIFFNIKKYITINLPKSKIDYNVKAKGNFEYLIFSKLESLEVKKNEINLLKENNDIIIKAVIPKGKPFEWIVYQFDSLAKISHYNLYDCEFDSKKRTVLIDFISAYSKNQHVKLLLSNSERYFKKTAIICFVIEELENIDYQKSISILSLNIPLSISLIHGNAKAKLIAQFAEQHNKEIIIRIPLEPIGKIPSDYENKTIMVHYSKEKIRDMISNIVNIYPKIAGFSNLWGTRGMEDSRLMKIIMEEIKKRNLYFFESTALKTSIASIVADSLNIPYLKSDCSLQKNNVSDLVLEIRNYINLAHIKGQIIIKCSAEKPIYQALSSMSAVFNQYGITLQYVSEIAKKF